MGLKLRFNLMQEKVHSFQIQISKNLELKFITSVSEPYSSSDIILKVNPPLMNEEIGKHEVDMMKENSIYISFIQTKKDIQEVKKLQEKNITAFSMHLVPRITLAQKMDALSSK